MNELFQDQRALTDLHRDWDDAFPSQEGRCNDEALIGLRTSIVGGRLGAERAGENESGGVLFLTMNHVCRNATSLHPNPLENMHAPPL